MRNYILTRHERKIIKEYLSDRSKANDFTSIVYHARKNVKILKMDYELLGTFLSNVGEKAKQRRIGAQRKQKRRHHVSKSQLCINTDPTYTKEALQSIVPINPIHQRPV